MATNRLTLKVALKLDKTKALQDATKLQKEFDKKFNESANKQKKANDEVVKQQTVINKNQKEQNTLFGGLSKILNRTIVSFVKFSLVTRVFRALTKEIKSALQLMLQLDTAFTNFSIVSKATATQLANVDKQTQDLALELGKLRKEVIDTVTEFSRAGFSISESLTLARNAIIGANVGATSLSNVTTFLIAGLKSFNLEAEASTQILDVLFRVANTTAINLEGIGEAFLRSANTLNTAGASLEESASLIAAANESIQDPAKVGTALKTIASRLRGVGENGEAIPKLADDFERIGISITTAEGGFRDIFSIFRDFANKYDEIDELTRESLLEKVAGKRQKNILIGLLENFDTAEQALVDALNSAGETAQANEKFLDSLQGRTNQLREAWNQLLTALSNDSAVKATVTGLTGIVKGITDIIEKAPIVIGLFGGLIAVLNPFTGLAGLAVTAVGALFGGIGVLNQGFALFRDSVERSTEKLREINEGIAELNTRIGDLEGIERRTEAQENLLNLLKEQLELEKSLRAEEEKRIADKRQENINKELQRTELLTNEIADASKAFSEGLFESDLETLEDFNKDLDKIKKPLIDFRIELEEAQGTLDAGTEAYEANAESIRLIDERLAVLNQSYEEFGFVSEEAKEAVQEVNRVVQEQISLLEEVRGLTATASDEYQILSDALLQIETTGFLTDDMLNTLIETFGASIVQVINAKDAFADYVDSNKTKTLEEIERLESLAQAEIDTAKARIEALKALNLAQGGFSLVEAFKDADLAIRNAENNLALLENERKQLEGVDKAREDAIKKSQKEVKVLSDLELKLKEVNFQIDLQKKLLGRTDVEEEQIEINNTLIELYEQQRDLLIEQQRELEAQGKSLQKGTEEYDDYINASYELALAIEDSTNSIIDLTRANNELNKSIAEGELDKLAESIEEIGNSINDTIEDEIENLKNLAKASEEYYDNLIESKEKEIEALKEANEQREEQIKLEGLLQDLQDLRERRENILNQRNQRLVKDAEVGFELIADRDELKEVDEQIKETQDAIADFRREQVLNENVRRIEEEISTLETIAQNEQDSYDRRIDELETFQDLVNSQIANGGQITQEITASIVNGVQSIENASYNNRLSSLQSFINSYNAKLATLNSTQARIQSIESSINASVDNIVAQSNNANTITAPKATTTSVSASTKKTSAIARKIEQSAPSSSSSTSIARLTVNTGSRTVEGIVDDALSIVGIID